MPIKSCTVVERNNMGSGAEVQLTEANGVGS